MNAMHYVIAFDAVGWAAGRASGLSKTEWWGAGMVISAWSELQTCIIMA